MWLCLHGALYGLGEAFLSCRMIHLLGVSRLVGSHVERRRAVASIAMPDFRPRKTNTDMLRSLLHQCNFSIRQELLVDAVPHYFRG